MEPTNTQNNQPAANQSPRPEPAVNIPQATVITDQKVGGTSSKMLVIVFVVLLLLILTGGGGYWFMTRNSASSSTTASTDTKSQQNVLGALKKDLDSVNIEEANAQDDMTQLDKDLSQL